MRPLLGESANLTLQQALGMLPSIHVSSPTLTERGGRLGLCPQVLRHLLEGHDDAVLRVHVQEAHLVADLEAIEAALLDDAYIEAVAGCVHHSGPHTAAGRGPRHQYCVNVHLVEVPDEGSPEKATGPTLRNDEVL